jgi:hypothetical protein
MKKNLYVANQLHLHHTCVYELFQATGNVVVRHIPPEGRVINIGQQDQVVFSHRRNGQLNARVNSRGIDFNLANGDHTQN